MDWTAEEDLAHKYCLISSQESFLTRFMDSQFRHSWNGFWQPPIKCLNYFTYDYNQRPLTSERINVAHLRGDKLCLEYDLGPIKITEEDLVHRQNLLSILEIKNSSEQDQQIDLSLEVGLTAADGQGNKLDFSSRFDQLRQAVGVRSKDRSVLYGLVRGKGEVSWEANEIYETKATTDSDGQRKSFSPGDYQVTGEVEAGSLKRLPFIFSFTPRDQDVRLPFDVALNSWFEQKFIKSGHIHKNRLNTSLDVIDNGYDWSNVNLKDLYYLRGQEDWQQGQKLIERNKGQGTGVIVSGLPHSLYLSSRDLLWSLLGLLDMGEFRVAEEQLQLLAKMRGSQKLAGGGSGAGRLPSRVSLAGEPRYQAADVDPLFLLLLSYYRKYTGDRLLPQEFEKSLRAIEVKQGLVKHGPQETWMDTVNRGQSAVEIQAMLLTMKKVASDLDLKGINYYWDGEALADSVQEGKPSTTRRANMIFPLFFGLVKDRDKALQVLKFLNTNLVCPQGVATLSPKEENYDPRSKYRGAVWSWLTLMAAAANLRYDRTGKATSLINKVATNFERDQIGALPAYVDADKGEVIADSNHSTASSLFFHTVDSFILGVKPQLHQSQVELSPKLPRGWKQAIRKDKRLGDNFMEIKLRRKQVGDNIKVKLKFKQRPQFKLKLVAPGRGGQVKRQGREEGKSVTFKPDRDNSLELIA